jgi:hypothetical protein
MFDAVSKGKGMANLQIIPSKNMTITNLMAQTFPRIKCFDNAETPFISPSTVAYIHALSIDCLALQNEDSINARALQHEAAMLGAYYKMTSEKLKKQLQAVLTTYYEDIRSIQGARGCPKPKFVTRSFVGTEEQDDTLNHNNSPADAAATPTDTEDASGAAGGAAALGAGGSQEPEEPPPAPQPPAPAKAAPAKPARGSCGGKGKPDADQSSVLR